MDAGKQKVLTHKASLLSVNLFMEALAEPGSSMAVWALFISQMLRVLSYLAGKKELKCPDLAGSSAVGDNTASIH